MRASRFPFTRMSGPSNFCLLEDYFGHQRAKGGRSDNPTAQQLGYNDLTIATQRDIAPVVRGNVGGRYGKKKTS